MSETPTTNIHCVGAVSVLADQFGREDNPTSVAQTPDPFLLRLYASEEVLSQLGREGVKDIGFKIIGSSTWAAKIIAMQDGDKALLPSQHGFYCVVRRYADEAALGILEIKPSYKLDWSDMGEAQE